MTQTLSLIWSIDVSLGDVNCSSTLCSICLAMQRGAARQVERHREMQQGNLGRPKAIFQIVFKVESCCPHFFILKLIAFKQRGENPPCKCDSIPALYCSLL